MAATTETVDQVVLNTEIRAAVGEVPGWVMIARTGAWRGHPRVTEQRITPDDLRSALDYFEQHYVANGADLVIDYHHASVAAGMMGTRAPAAGWISEMDLRNEGTELWGKVLWTAEAANSIGAREYRYLSPVLRYNARDRVTGDPVPMILDSVALTNRPFLTELQSLNEAAAMDGGGEAKAADTEGENMKLLLLIATAIGLAGAEVAQMLGLAEDADDKAVAEAISGLATKVGDLEAELETAKAAAEQAAEGPPVSEAVANALGIAADSNETDMRAAILKLQAPGGAMTSVRTRLGLDEGSSDQDVLNEIGGLIERRRKTEAEELVQNAVEGGKIPPAQQEFYLKAAESDLDAARMVINDLPVMTEQAAHPNVPDKGGKQLTSDQKHICELFGITEEQFLAAG